MTIAFYGKELLAKHRPKVVFPRDLRLQDHVREMRDNGQQVYEFVGTDTFGAEWYTRQRYEVDSGRQEEPILYLPIYEEIRDSSLPKNVGVQRLGPGGVVLEEIFEGGEVKFATIESSEFSVPIRHWGTGLEYSKDLVVFNELWRVPVIERAVGIAYNALLNHVHLSPILTATYGSANQSAAVTSGATTVEDFFLTVEAGITASKSDTTNPRRGPYILLINSAQQFTVEKALQQVPQQGAAQQSSALDMVRSVVAYDGWTGVRGNKTVTYPGVTSGKAYLISQQYRGQDFQSFMKQDLMEEGRDQDISRFLTQVVWDCYFGVYANPIASVEELTWPS